MASAPNRSKYSASTLREYAKDQIISAAVTAASAAEDDEHFMLAADIRIVAASLAREWGLSHVPGLPGTWPEADAPRATHSQPLRNVNMTTPTLIPVAGYTSQSDENIKLANEGKEIEERYLRWLDKIGGHNSGPTLACDPRSIALARTHIQDGAMWAIRAIFWPQRIKLPEDGA